MTQTVTGKVIVAIAIHRKETEQAPRRLQLIFMPCVALIKYAVMHGLGGKIQNLLPQVQLILATEKFTPTTCFMLAECLNFVCTYFLK